MVKADKSFQSLQDITPDVEFLKIKKIEREKHKSNRKFDEKTYGTPSGSKRRSWF